MEHRELSGKAQLAVTIRSVGAGAGAGANADADAADGRVHRLRD